MTHSVVLWYRRLYVSRETFADAPPPNSRAARFSATRRSADPARRDHRAISAPESGGRACSSSGRCGRQGHDAPGGDMNSILVDEPRVRANSRWMDSLRPSRRARCALLRVRHFSQCHHQFRLFLRSDAKHRTTRSTASPSNPAGARVAARAGCPKDARRACSRNLRYRLDTRWPPSTARMVPVM